jgi:PAS domain S-box-containing protein
MHDGYGKVTMSLAVTRDITRRKQEEHHLKLLESVITNTNEAVVITEAEPFDEPGPRIVYVNKAFTKMTGYSENEVLGKSPRFLRGPKSDKNELNRLGEAIRKNQACEITTVNYKKNGEEFWINLNVSPIANEKGIITHWISIERDITQKKFYELEREQIIAELSQNNKDLKQFSYVTSHNLRAPIANLLGLSSLIDHYKIDNEELKHILDGVKQSAMMFDETVRELSQVLIIKDEINVTKENISVVAIINKTLTQLSIALDDNKVKVNYDLIKALTVTFSSSYLESIFINLFTNALKYKSNQHNLEINISSESTKEYDVVKFSDNGIGIDIETHREKLFKLYQQFHENSEGKGLGLYLVKSQMEALGGTVDVESEVGKGTTFILKFKKYPKE